MILSRHGPVDTATSGQKLEASSLAGAISGGSVIGLMRTFSYSYVLLPDC